MATNTTHRPFRPGAASRRWLVLGVVLMQFCVQGAWGVLSAHAAELSPDPVRGTLPGFANQVGLVVSSLAVYVEAAATKGRMNNLKGGLPLIVEGQVVGGIGVGSGTGEQDLAVAEFAVAAFAGGGRG